MILSLITSMLLSPDSNIYIKRSVKRDVIEVINYTYGPTWYQLQWSPYEDFRWKFTKEIGYGDSSWHTNEIKIDRRWDKMFFRVYSEPANFK